MTQSLDDKRWHVFEENSVALEDFPADGYILDIGGGGEGIITQLKGSQVVAIDQSDRELKGIPGDSLRIVMDAREMKFLDESFNTVTGFFCLMFVKPEDHIKVIREVYRVLKPGGRFLVWDGCLPPKPVGEKDLFILPLKVALPGREIETGFGFYWPEFTQDLDYFRAIAETAGFQAGKMTACGRTFFMELIK